MAVLTWDQVGERFYEAGLDRGVLYLSDGRVVVWNGLTSITERFNRETSSVYYDGKKINNLIGIGDFEASMRALTYPDEFLEVEGAAFVKPGFMITEQNPQAFGLCYRTKIGNDTGAENYKLHILYNVTAVPNEKTYATISDDPNASEFEWDILAVPEEVAGFHPTAHLVLDSREFDPLLLDTIEQFLYGTASSPPALLPLSWLVSYIIDWVRYTIENHGDGTFTITTTARNGIQPSPTEEGEVTIRGINTTKINSDTILLHDTPAWSAFP